MKYLRSISTTSILMLIQLIVFGQGSSIKNFQDNFNIRPENEVLKLNVIENKSTNGPNKLNTQLATTDNTNINIKEHSLSDRRFFFGLTGGIGFSTGRYDYVSSTPPPALSVRLGTIAGISMDWRISDHFSLQFNTMYKEKGDRINMNDWIKSIDENDDEENAGGTVIAEGFRSTKLSYIEASFLPVIVIGKVIEIGAGGFVGYGLNGKRVDDYIIQYDFPEFPIEDESFSSEIPVNFILLVPTTFEDNKLYLNSLDYGGIGHLGIRIKHLKISLMLSYSLKQLEPDSKLSSLFFEDINHTYNLNSGIIFSWMF